MIRTIVLVLCATCPAFAAPWVDGTDKPCVQSIHFFSGVEPRVPLPEGCPALKAGWWVPDAVEASRREAEARLQVEVTELRTALDQERDAHVRGLEECRSRLQNVTDGLQACAETTCLPPPPAISPWPERIWSMVAGAGVVLIIGTGIMCLDGDCNTFK